MARYKGWKTTMKDVREFNRLLVGAEGAVNEARNEMMDSLGMAADIVDELLPTIPDFNSANASMLHDEFINRADFDRTKRYLGRIIRASEAKPRRGTVPIVPDVANQLTSFYIDDDGIPSESAFMRSEAKLFKTNQNRTSLRRLKERGVEMERKKVLEYDHETGEYVEARDEWGKPVFTWQPATPANRDAYYDAIERDSSLMIEQPDEATGGYVNIYGDIIPVTQARRHRISPKTIAESQMVDAQTDSRTSLYFNNYQAIVDTTLPEGIANEFDGYIDRINELSPVERAKVYDYIDTNGEDAATIEYLYLDSGSSLPAKVQRILTFWREKIAPMIDMDTPEDDTSVDGIASMMEQSGYVYGSGQNIYGEYQARKQSGDALHATLESMRNVQALERNTGKRKRKKRKKDAAQ